MTICSLRERAQLLLLLLTLLACGFSTATAQDDDDGGFDENVDLAEEYPGFTDLFDIDAPPSAAADGYWSVAARWPIVAIHAALLPNGEVLTYGTNEYAHGGLGFVYDRWDPSRGLAPNSHSTLDVQTSNNLFCSAQTLLPGSGGLMLVTGGSVEKGGSRNFGIKAVNIYDPLTDEFDHRIQAMKLARWYPTVTVLADGRVLLQGGRDDKRQPTLTPEIFDPDKGTWKLLTRAKSTTVYGGNGWNYPRSFLCSNGKVLVMPRSTKDIYYLSTGGRGRLTRVRELSVAPSSSNNLAVMYETDKILSVRARDARRLTVQGDRIRSANISDFDTPRFWADATLLPNGEVLITGGSAVNQSLSNAVNAVDIWNPVTETWRRGAAGHKARLYHSTSLLLPNGTVLVAGGGPPGPTANLNAEIYYPPYLFDESGDLRTRPRLLGDGSQPGSEIRIRARGDEGTERFALKIDGQTVSTFDVTRQLRTYSYTSAVPVTGDQVRVEFLNDEWLPNEGFDANLTVEWVEIGDDRKVTTDSRVYSWDVGGNHGYLERKQLLMNGYFEYFDESTGSGCLDLGVVGYGDSLTCRFDRADSISAVRLIRFGSVTHSFDMGQRGCTLPFSQNAGEVTMTLPSARKELPPGHYMLFIVDQDGTPSEAAVLEVL